MKYVYDQLIKIEFIKDKLHLCESNDLISINFHEYLHLDISNDYIVLNKGLTHWHGNDDDIIQDVTDIANGDLIYIERRGFFTRPRKWGMRIYTAKSIIKRSAK